MHRRKFIRHSLACLLAGPLISRSTMAADNARAPVASWPDLVAVKGGEPAELLDRGLAAIGGIQRFVNRGQTVVVKPNIGWDAPPEQAANTNPVVVRRLVEHCFDAGARRVYVLDHTCDPWRKCYRNSGIEAATREAGGKLVPGNDAGHYGDIEVPRGRSLTKAKVHELIAECDVLINVPVLKNHGGAVVSLAMKNLMGVVWDRGWWHRNDLHQCIADFPTWRQPDLNIIDGYRALLRNGPQGVSVKDTAVLRQMVLSTDIVAADTAATLLQNRKAREVPFLARARELGLGTTNLRDLRIERIVLSGS